MDYKSSAIIKMAGITKTQLNHWINMGAIEPSIDDRRRGGVRYFDQQGLFEVLFCKTLNEHQLPVQNISTVLQIIRNYRTEADQTLFMSFVANPEMEDYFAVVVPTTGSAREHFTDEDARAYRCMPFIVAGPKLVSFLTDFPTAIVINLSSILEQIASS